MLRALLGAALAALVVAQVPKDISIFGCSSKCFFCKLICWEFPSSKFLLQIWEICWESNRPLDPTNDILFCCSVFVLKRLNRKRLLERRPSIAGRRLSRDRAPRWFRRWKLTCWSCQELETQCFYWDLFIWSFLPAKDVFDLFLRFFCVLCPQSHVLVVSLLLHQFVNTSLWGCYEEHPREALESAPAEDEATRQKKSYQIDRFYETYWYLFYVGFNDFTK